MIFETKKIQLETLSEFLTEARQGLQLTQSEAAAKTNIKPKFLELLEQGDFSKLPADVYVFGFLRQLGALYSTDPGVLVEQYKKERVIAAQIQKKPLFNSSATRRWLAKIVITPKYLSATIGLLFVVVTLGYIVWQVSSINKIPLLVVSQPQDMQIIPDSAITVVGKTDPGMNLTINDQSIFVDSQGNFSKQISIDNGPKQLVFVVQNKFGKSASKTITVIGENSVPSASATNTSGLELKLEFIDSGTLTYSLDSAPEQTMSFGAGDTKVLSAKQKAVISTSNAGATRVIYNNQNLGLLGKSKEPLENVPFFAQTNTTSTSTK